MNTELKALVKGAADVVVVVEAAAQKQDFVTKVLPKLYAVAADVPAIYANFSDLQAEIAALKGADADADLVAFVLAEVAGVTSDEHAKKILAASFDLIEAVVPKAVALAEAIHG